MVSILECNIDLTFTHDGQGQLTAKSSLTGLPTLDDRS